MSCKFEFSVPTSVAPQCRSGGRVSESDLHHPAKPSVLEKPVLGPLIKLAPAPAAAHPAADKDNSSSDPSGRKENHILRTTQSGETSVDRVGGRLQQSADLRIDGGGKQAAYDLQSEEDEEELKISLRVEGFQPPAIGPHPTGGGHNRRSESKENLNPRDPEDQERGDNDQQSGRKAARKFRPRNETNEKFLDMEPLPEPPPTPPPGGRGRADSQMTRSTSPIPIPRGRGFGPYL
jgi:hypothetical protein